MVRYELLYSEICICVCVFLVIIIWEMDVVLQDFSQINLVGLRNAYPKPIM